MQQTEPTKKDMQKGGAIFVMPRSSRAWAGAEALWITVAGWAAAAERRYGKAWVVTADTIAAPKDVIDYPLGQSGKAPAKKTSSGIKKFIPSFVKTVLKDLALWRSASRFAIHHDAPWKGTDIAFVWQQHDLFPGPGRKLADDLGVPLVTYVHAPVVWETSKWGVNRYLWGAWLERFVEAKSLKQSDCVACVSQEVADKLAAMGVDQKRIVVSPMAVDPFLFMDTQRKDRLRTTLRLADDAFVIGWVGSFRSFHGLDLLVKAFDQVVRTHPEARLLLVGDGFEREGTEKLVHQLGLDDFVIFAGRQPFSKIPSYISVFDIAIVSAKSAEGFHYSPLKLREYLIAEKPTLAPRAGDLPMEFRHDEDVVFYNAGDIGMMAQQMTRLLEDKSLFERVCVNGKRRIQESGTWDYELQRVLRIVMH